MQYRLELVKYYERDGRRYRGKIGHVFPDTYSEAEDLMNLLKSSGYEADMQAHVPNVGWCSLWMLRDIADRCKTVAEQYEKDEAALNRRKVAAS